MVKTLNPIKLPKRSLYFLLLSNLALGLFIRYKANTGTESGSPDSWDYHLQINQIIIEGMISWIFHPLSYYGMYPPFSEVSIEVFLASTSILFGISVTHAILVTSIAIGLHCGLVGFVVSKEWFGDNFLSVIFAIILSCSPLIYQSTTWGVQKRLYVSLLLFLVLFFLVRIYRSNNGRFRFSFLLIITLLSFIGVHKSSLFVAIFFICFLFSFLINYYLPGYILKANRKPTLFFYVCVLVPVSLIVILGTFINQGNGETVLNPLYNNIFDLSMDLGLMAPFGIFGLFALRHRRIDFWGLFLILLFLSALFINFIIPQPRGLIREPVSFYMFHPIYYLLISLGVSSSVKFFKKRQIALPIIVLMLIFTSIIPEYVVVKPNTTSDEMSKTDLILNSISIGNYIEHEIQPEENEQIIEFGVLSDRIMSFAEGKYFYPPELTAINFTIYRVDSSYFFTSGKAEGFVKESGLRYTDLTSGNYLENSLHSERVRLDFKYYQVNHVIINPSYLKNHDDRLVSEIIAERYKIYCNDLGALHFVTPQ